jgi:hypothetical protein
LGTAGAVVRPLPVRIQDNIRPWRSMSRTPDDQERAAAFHPLERPMKTARLPDTDSIDDLAKFWDTHDLTDFEDRLDEIAEPVFRYGQKGVNVPLAPDEIEAAERVARSEGSDLADPRL